MKNDELPHAIYADGGVISRNPSKLGGTWCYVWVDAKGNQLQYSRGIVTPEEAGLDSITNNYTELLAVVKALQSVNKDWRGVLYTDSKVTLTRVTVGHSFKAIPNAMRLEVLSLRRGRGWQVSLLGGHPTKDELKQGFKRKNKLPVSKWNVFCDEQCKQLAKEFVSGKSYKRT